MAAIAGCAADLEGSGQSPAPLVSLSRVPGLPSPVPPTPVPATYFGMHFSSVGLQPWPIVPYGTRRDFAPIVYDADYPLYGRFRQLSWDMLNPAPGVYDWKATDLLMDLLSAHGDADNEFTFFISQEGLAGGFWAATPVGHVDVGAWTEFVSAFVERYRGRVRYLELFNEPNGQKKPDGSLWWPISNYVAMAKAAYAAIKAIDPGIKVLAPTVTFPSPPGTPYPTCDSGDLYYGDRWLDCFLGQGGVGTFDVLSFHGYWNAGHSRSTAAYGEDVLIPIARFKQVLARYDLEGVPLWDTEASFLNSEGDPQDRAAAIARYYLLQWSVGVERFYWFSYDDQGWVQSSLTGFLSSPNWNGLATPGGDVPPTLSDDGVAYTEVFKWMVGAFESGCQQDLRKTWSCALTRPGGYQALAVWNSVAPTAFSVPPGYRYVRRLDGTTERLGSSTWVADDSPVLFENQWSGLDAAKGSLGDAGNLDGIDSRTALVRGWAYDPSDPTVSVLMQLYLDGPAGSPGSVFVGAAQTDILRQDVNEKRRISGTHGFELRLPAKYWDGKPHQLYAYTLLESPGHQGELLEINSSPLPFALQPQVPDRGNLERIVSSPDSMSLPGESIEGWAWNPLTPDDPIRVFFYMDGPANEGGFYVGSTIADIPRNDLAQKGIGATGNHGFKFQLRNMSKGTQIGWKSFDPTVPHRIYAHPEAPSNPPIYPQAVTFTQAPAP
jgi:hypothetical protein